MDREDLVILLATTLVILNPGIVMLILQVMFLDVVSDFQVAVLSTMYWIPIFLFASVWGYIADVLGDRRIVAVSTQFIVGILTVMHMFFSSYWSIFILRFLTGMFGAAYTPAIQGYITENAREEYIGEKLGIYNTGVAVGFLLSGVASSALLYMIEIRFTFLFAGMFSVLASFSIMCLPKKESKTDFVGNPRRLFESISSLRAVAMLKEGKAYFAVVALAVRHVAVMGLFSVVFLYMQRLGVPKELLGLVSSVNNLVQVILIMPLGRIADKEGYKKIFVPGFVLSAFIPIVFLFARNTITLAVAFAYIGLAYSLLIAGVNPYLRKAAPKGHESEVLSLINTTRAFGMIFGPIFVGLLVDNYGYSLMFFSTMIVGLFAALLSLLAEEL